MAFLCPLVVRLSNDHRNDTRAARCRACSLPLRGDRGPLAGRPIDPRLGAAYAQSVIVAHLDLDAFFAAVEELERPELRTVPLVVGGDPHGRGVVATANYAARRFGIVSAMSCAEALRRCPATVFVRPRHSLYREYSHEVWSIV